MKDNKLKATDAELVVTTISDLVIRYMNPGLSASWPFNHYLMELYRIIEVDHPVYIRPQTQFERQANRRTNQQMICLMDSDTAAVVMRHDPNTINLVLPKEHTIYPSLLAKLKEVEKSFEVKLLTEEADQEDVPRHVPRNVSRYEPRHVSGPVFYTTDDLRNSDVVSTIEWPDENTMNIIERLRF